MKSSSLLGSLVVLAAALAPVSLWAQLTTDWMIPAAAHNAGQRGTFWRTDLSLHNPHDFELPVVVQALPSDAVNHEVPTMTITLAAWETFNLWDVLGPDGFDLEETAAILAYAEPSLQCDPIEECHLLVTSRTYTLAPGEGGGEFGLAVPGTVVERAGDWSTLSYAAGILNDGEYFRCNVGVASWTVDWTVVHLDIQDSDGSIIASETFDVPPFGHTQRSLDTLMTGGSLVFYVEDGPDDVLIFPYATVIDEATGDASFFFAEASIVGAATKRGRPSSVDRPSTPTRGPPVMVAPRVPPGAAIPR